MTIATITYPEKKNWEISKFFALDIVPTGDVCPKCIFFSLRGRPILLITRMITDRIELHSILSPLL